MSIAITSFGKTIYIERKKPRKPTRKIIKLVVTLSVPIKYSEFERTLNKTDIKRELRCLVNMGVGYYTNAGDVLRVRKVESL
jgi:hypothetical protein